MAYLTDNPQQNDNVLGASSSSASTSYPRYDVFLNHRGPDVKNTFAAHLYRRLLDHGLRVFLDKPELEPGHNILSQIEAAIQGASIQIAILSPTYADSKWCLDELVLMVKSRATILPVFYKVKPSELRWTLKDGAYADALSKHQQKTTRDPETSEEKPRHGSSTIQAWRDALSHVADISGFELDAFNGNEQELLDNVVRSVMKIVPKTPLFVAKYPTGLEDKLQDFESTVLSQQGQEQNMQARVVGIVGGGGIGKTTLAKEFFNRRSSQYNGSSFLFDVRETAARTSLIYLQMKLIKDLTQKQEIKIESPDQGITILKRDLSYCHALLILDDVDKADQLEAFLPIKDVLSSHSLILVTSRDKHLLISSGIVDSSIYKLAGMSTIHSRELLCSYAFYHPHPLPGFTDLVERFVTACDGLPLSLKVIGALLCGRDATYWEEQLNELNSILPEAIQERLKISYRSLNQEEQKIFLDIACFFIGEEMDTAIRIWGSVGILNIESKCLLEVGSGNKIKIHDHVRDMGRNIAEERLMPLRLWRHTTNNNIIKLFEDSLSAITEVRGISTVPRADYLYDVEDSEMSRYKRWRHEVLENCKRTLFSKDGYYGTNLQIVASEDGYLKGILRRVRSPHLLWIRWYRCPYSSLPSWLPMEHLRVLEVVGTRLNLLWKHESLAPLQLRELNIYSPISHFPNSIGHLKHLEKVVVDFKPAVPLETLPEEFFDLCSLKYLALRSFSRMRSLPDSLGKLTNLQHIDLSYAKSLQMLPDSFGKLVNLQHINLSDCYSLAVLPNSFGNLTRLKYLSLNYCKKVTISNETLGNVTALEFLDLSFCEKVKELPPQVAHQRSLEKLYLGRAHLKELAIGDLCNLEVLQFGRDHLLEVLPPSLGYLNSLKVLSVENCRALKCLPDTFGLLTQLTELRLQSCGIQYLPQDLLRFNNLEYLEVANCPLGELPSKTAEGKREAVVALNEFDSSSNDKCLFGLKTLKLRGVEIRELTFPEGVCPNLQRLQLFFCNELKQMGRQMGRLCGLEKLQYLEIRSCGVEELSCPETWTPLEALEVHGCSKLKSIQGLRHLTKLRRLQISWCGEIEELPSLEHLTSLESLKTYGCPKLKCIQGLAQLTKLGRIDVSGCHELEELPGVERLKSLMWLDAGGCPKLQWGGGVVEQLRQRLKENLIYDSKSRRRRLQMGMLCANKDEGELPQ